MLGFAVVVPSCPSLDRRFFLLDDALDYYCSCPDDVLMFEVVNNA